MEKNLDILKIEKLSYGVDVTFKVADGLFVKNYVGQGDSLKELKDEVKEPYLSQALDHLATVEHEPIPKDTIDDLALTESERLEQLEQARIKAAELTAKMDQELDELLLAQLGGSDG